MSSKNVITIESSNKTFKPSELAKAIATADGLSKKKKTQISV